jgi:hypothetical protein
MFFFCSASDKRSMVLFGGGKSGSAGGRSRVVRFAKFALNQLVSHGFDDVLTTLDDLRCGIATIFRNGLR